MNKDPSIDLLPSSIHLECNCGSQVDHFVRVSKWPKSEIEGDVDLFYVHSQLNHYLPWYKRIPLAFRYLFGIDNTFCHYIETLLTVDQVKELATWLDKETSN